MSEDTENYKICKQMQQSDIDERKNIEIEIQAPNKEDALELYEEAKNQ